MKGIGDTIRKYGRSGRHVSKKSVGNIALNLR